jgi:Ca-activated chloride channel homolog
MRRTWTILLTGALLALVAAPALADGFIVVRRHPPDRPQVRNVPLAVKYHRVKVEIQDQVAVTHIDQVFVNPNGWQVEGRYIFPLPDDASVTKFSMYIDGKEVQGELLEKEKARKIYEDIVRRMQDPALLEYIGTRMFQARIFPIPGRAERRIKLTYSEVLENDGGLVEYRYPLNTEKFSSKPLEDCSVDVTVSSKHPIRSVYSPSHRIDVVRKTETSVRASYEAKNVKPDQDFLLYYTQSTKDVAINVLTHRPPAEDGTFMVMLAPGDTGSKVVAKDVIFVQDTSGSMLDDGKINQARKALAFCLKSLGGGDRFNIISFATEARPFRDGLIPVTAESREAALIFINRLEAVGGTNIDEALQTAIGMVKDDGRPCMIVFLTDGKPTIGETDTDRLTKGIAKIGKKNVRLFTFGVGNDVNAPLLDRLATENRGAPEYVDPKEDLEVKIGSFYGKIAHPVLADLKLFIEGVETLDVYPKMLPDLFKGGQLIAMGRYKGKGPVVVRLKGNVNGEPREIVHEVNFAGRTDENGFLPRIWSLRKVGYLLEQMRLHGESKEVKDEIVRLARRHGIVTPYTSFLVLENEEMLSRDETARRQLGDDAPAAGRATRHAFGARPRAPAGARSGGSSGRDAGAGSGGGAPAPAADAPMAEEDRESAREGFRGVSGRGAVDASDALRRLKKAKSLDGDKDSRLNQEALRYLMRRIGGKTFYFDVSLKLWIDSMVKVEAERQKVKYLSDAYFALIAKIPEMGRYLSLGSKVIVNHAGTVYEIVEK